MAIAAQNATYTTNGPTGSSQIFSYSAQSNNEVQHIFTSTVTLDGATTNFVVNFIDGTQTLPYIPTAVEVDIVGGTQVPVSVLSTATGTPTNTGVTVYLSGAGTSGNTLKILGKIIR